MKRSIRLMGLCLLIVACIVFAACNNEVEVSRKVLVTHFGDGDLESSSYTVNTMSVEADSNEITVEDGDYTYVHTLNDEKTAVSITKCYKAEALVYTATYDGTTCNVEYADGKILNVTYKNNGKLESVSDGTTEISYSYNVDGVTRTDSVKKDNITLTNTVVLTDGVWRKTETKAPDYTTAYTYDGNKRTETTTFKASDLKVVTEFVDGVKTTVTQVLAEGNIVSTYDANGDLVSRVQNGKDLLTLFAAEKVANGYKITGYTGEDTVVEIPAAINLTPVVEIAANAFQGKANITSVAIPTTVKKIGANAFSGTGISSVNGVYLAGNWAVGVEAGATEVTLEKSVVGIADGALAVNGLTVTYNGTQNEWTKVLKGTNWHGTGYALELNPGNKVDGYIAKDEYGFTTGEIALKNRGEYAATESLERLLHILNPFGVAEAEDAEGTADLRFANSFEVGVRYDDNYVYLAVRHKGDTGSEFLISLNPDHTTAGQIDVYVKGTRYGIDTKTVTVYTDATTSTTAADYLVASAVDYIDNGMENVNTFELQLDRAKLEEYAGGEFETLGFIAQLVRYKDGVLDAELVYGDEKAAIKPYVSPVKTMNGEVPAVDIGYHVLSLREEDAYLGLTSGWLLADYGFKQQTFDLGTQLERTAAPVVDGGIQEDEYTWNTSLSSNPGAFFYIDENGYNDAEGNPVVVGIPAEQKSLDISLAHDKNYIYAAVIAKGVHDVDKISFRIGNTGETGKAWNVTVTRDTGTADYKEAVAEGNVNHNTITVITTEQTVEHARDKQDASTPYNPAQIVVGRAMTVSGDTITLEIAFDRGALERDADNPDLDRLYLHVSRTMAKYETDGAKSYGEIHFGFRAEEGDTSYDAAENCSYDNAIHRYHQSIFNRFPHVITFTAPAAPVEQAATGTFQVGYGITNITPWLDDMGIADNDLLLNVLDKESFRDFTFVKDGSSKHFYVKNDDGSLSVQLAGYMGADNRYSTHVEDEIFATCIAFKDADGDVALLVSLDVLHFTTEEPISLYDNVMRALRPLGFEEGDVIISATHTHTSVNIFGAAPSNRFAYTPYFYEQIYNAAAAAVEDLKDVSAISTNYHTTSSQLSFERRGYDAEGFWANSVSNSVSQTTGIFESDYEYNGEKLGRDNKTADSDIQMVRIDRVGQDKPVVIANWSAHPDNVTTKDDSTAATYNQPLSGDYIYYMRDKVDESYNFAFFQGASGNTVINSKVNKSTNLAYDVYGTTLGTELLTGLENMKDRSVEDLSIEKSANELGVYYEASQVGMPVRVSDAIDLVADFYDGKITMAEAEAKLRDEINPKRIADGLTPFSSVYECASLRHRYSVAKDAAHEFDFVAITMGDVTFASAPYEMFWQTAWDIRNADTLSDKTILVLTHANGTYGYIPTQEIMESREGLPGGYEVAVCNYQKGSAEIIAENIVDLIEQNYGIN